MSEDVSMWMNCKKCMDELPVGMSPKEFSIQQAGVTPTGEIVVWCMRHNMGVARLKLDPKEMEQFGKCGCPGCSASSTCH